VKRNEGDTWDFTFGNYRECPFPRCLFLKLLMLLVLLYTLCPEKRCHSSFDFNSRISWSISKNIFVPLETEMNTPQLDVIYLLNALMTS